MNEPKIYEKLLEHDERLQVVEEKLGHLDGSMRTLQNSADKILHIVERLDQERIVTSHRIDSVEHTVARLEGV